VAEVTTLNQRCKKEFHVKHRKSGKEMQKILNRMMQTATATLHKMPQNGLLHFWETDRVLQKRRAHEGRCFKMEISKPHEPSDTEQC
jgi:predicted ATP-binding protein involved in virulence